MTGRLRNIIQPRSEVYVYIIGAGDLDEEGRGIVAGRVIQILEVAESRFEYGDEDSEILKIIREGTKFAFPNSPEVNYVLSKPKRLTVYVDFTKDNGHIYTHTNTH